MGTDGDTELRGHQHHGKDFVDPAEARRIDLTDRDGVGLQELLEHDAVLDVFAGRHAHRGDTPGDGRVTEDVVGARRLLDPIGVELDQAFTQAIASSTSQRWLASIAIIASGPISARTMRARRRSSSRSAPTFSLKLVQPRPTPRGTGRRILSSS
jgi:hypothetical protein